MRCPIRPQGVLPTWLLAWGVEPCGGCRKPTTKGVRVLLPNPHDALIHVRTYVHRQTPLHEAANVFATSTLPARPWSPIQFNVKRVIDTIASSDNSSCCTNTWVLNNPFLHPTHVACSLFQIGHLARLPAMPGDSTRIYPSPGK